MATSKAFIGPPEVRGRGHSGLSEDITGKNSEDPDDDTRTGDQEAVLVAEAEVATSKAPIGPP